jgi:tetratricopeptide (TPR) repeat protein
VEEHSGHLDAAIDVYNRALRVDDHHERAKISLARLCHTHRNDYILAENYLTTAIRNNSNSHEAW